MSRSGFRWLVLFMSTFILLTAIPFLYAQFERVSGGDTAFLPVVYTDCDDYFDNFSDPSSGWQVLDEPSVRLAYTNGEYQVMSRQTGLLFRPLAPAPQRENYVVEVDAHYNAPPTDGLYGLVFGVETVGAQVTDYYLYTVDTNLQEYRLRYRDGTAQTWHTITGPTSSTAINPGTAVNHLTAVRNGDQITLEVNGTVLGTWVDNRITGFTFTGVAHFSNPANPQADARFDNYHVHICYPGIPAPSPSAAFYNNVPTSVYDTFLPAGE